ncbi:MAG: hypothetical protein NT062_03740 [Proteobacteria bacterium]|nr:hypothetical protein [Pseudomonadota bacterium]
MVGCGTSPSDPAPAYNTWSPLITKSWTLEPGTEHTSDINLVNLDEDVYVGGIRPIAPPGTHHTLVARGETAAIDAGNIIYASGVGTEAVQFPPGAGLKLAAGTLVGLQLHTFNTGDVALQGTSGAEIYRVAPEDFTDEVDLVLAGSKTIALPPNTTTTVTGTCIVKARQTVFALFPHMHQLGTHFKTTLTVGGVAHVIHDAPYAFEHQPFLAIEPVVLEPGDTITTECTWNNTTASMVTFGESSETEMCFSIMYRFPARGDAFCYQ